MKRLTTLALVAAIAALSACAPRASSVAPVPMTGAFDSMTCQRAQAQLAAERANVEALSERQNAAATGDAIGVFLIAVPTSSVFGGNVQGELATAKGKVLALEQRVARC